MLRKSRSSITCALLKAQCAREPPVDEEKKNLKPNDQKVGESKRGSLMSIKSNSTCSTDISRACSKETYDDWLVSDELLDILSGMFMTKFLFLRHAYDYIFPPLAFLFIFISFFFFVLSSFLLFFVLYSLICTLHFFVVSFYSDPSPLNSRRPSTDSIGAGYSYIRNNLKHESTSGAYLTEAANKKNRNFVS